MAKKETTEQPATPAAQAWPPPLKCPLCGNSDPARMLIYSGRWLSVPPMTMPANIIQPPPRSVDTIECRGPCDDGESRFCQNRGSYEEFALCGSGVAITPTVDIETHGQAVAVPPKKGRARAAS